MQEMSTVPPQGIAVASGIVGDAYVASLAVVMTGDGTTRRVEMDGSTFEALLTAIEMRPHGFDSRTRAFRSHSARSIFLVQRIDRLWPAIESLASDVPGLIRASDQLRDLAELCDTVSWRLA